VRWALALPLLLLAACSKGPDAPAATHSPEAVPTPDKPHSLVPADFAKIRLGAKIKGADGDGKFVSDGQNLAEVPAGTVYTYVHRVTPGTTVASATLFRTARPAAGFANGVGYDNAEATAALSPNGEIDVEADNGALVWRVIGGDHWKAGEPITLFWQSTQPPAPAREAYLVETDGSVAMGSGPFPAKEKAVDGAAER
jgi:hypothetical protein